MSSGIAITAVNSGWYTVTPLLESIYCSSTFGLVCWHSFNNRCSVDLYVSNILVFYIYSLFSTIRLSHGQTFSNGIQGVSYTLLKFNVLTFNSPYAEYICRKIPWWPAVSTHATLLTILAWQRSTYLLSSAASSADKPDCVIQALISTVCRNAHLLWSLNGMDSWQMIYKFGPECEWQ